MLITCERSKGQARSLLALVEQWACSMPAVDAGLFREMWRPQGVAWAATFMTGIMPRDLAPAIRDGEQGD